MSQNTTAMQCGAGGETTGATDMTTQQTDALQCAADLEYSIARHGMQDSFTLNAYRAMKMVRTQHARIADLEAQLEAIGAGGVSGPLIGQPQAMPDLSNLTERGAKAWAGVDAQALREGRWYMVTHDGVATLCEDRRDAEKEAKDADMAWPHSGPHRAVQLVEASTAGFTAADMATASAQGFRDGVASVAANAREPVYQARYQKWFWQDSSRECYEYLQNPENTCAEDWETRILYTHPPTAQAEGWTTLPGQMPEPNTPVLLDIGKKFPIRALWAEKHTVRVGADVDDWGEYDEETDEYYCPEGWYEWNEHEEVHWAVSETPRAWRELPHPSPPDGMAGRIPIETAPKDGSRILLHPAVEVADD